MAKANEAREALRVEVAARKERQENIDSLEAAIRRAQSTKHQAQLALNAANEGLEKAKQASARQMADDMRAGGKGDRDPAVLRGARAAVVEAEDNLAATDLVIQSLNADLEEINKIDVYNSKINGAMVKALEQPASELLARAIQSLVTYRAQKLALNFLLSKNLIVAEINDDVRAFLVNGENVERITFGATHRTIPDRGIGDLVEAVNQLRIDADTPIPVI